MEVCRRLRIKKDTSIIMLTAKGDITDKVNGLDIGADDYLTKPQKGSNFILIFKETDFN